MKRGPRTPREDVKAHMDWGEIVRNRGSPGRGVEREPEDLYYRTFRVHRPHELPTTRGLPVNRLLTSPTPALPLNLGIKREVTRERYPGPTSVSGVSEGPGVSERPEVGKGRSRGERE